MKKNEIITGKAILVKGFWTQCMQYNGATLPDSFQTKWIVFQGLGEPFMGDYVDLNTDHIASVLIRGDTKDNLDKFRKDQINYRINLLRGLDILDEIDTGDDIALWSRDYPKLYKTTPSSLHCVGDEYHDDYLTKYRLSEGKGSFVTGESIFDDKGNVAFAITKLFETRATRIDAGGNITLVKKEHGGRMVTKKNKIDSEELEKIKKAVKDIDEMITESGAAAKLPNIQSSTTSRRHGFWGW